MSIFSSLFSGALGAIIGFTGDWFLAIALLTIAIKGLLFPLSVKQRRGMLITQSFAEAQKMLNEKYKGKKELVTEGLTKIMAKYKVNPLSSIMMLLVQLPVFFSIYYTVSHLTTGIGSVIIPWVINVTKADTLHVLPVAAGLVQGALSFYSTPSQTRNFLMIALPIGIGLWFLWSAPVGVSVYWACNALFGIAELQLFKLRAIKERYLTVPSAEEMVAGIA
ncbi:MAG TPA: YidC/Oxa1 family membrane protein insertase [Candidatus Aquicultor sp.]|jgi:YidC/Oxa1 family membrane protein insertase